MGDTDIVLQGSLWDIADTSIGTFEAAWSYTDLDYVNNVIISLGKKDEWAASRYPTNPKIKWVFSDMPENSGPGNMNMQIVTSAAGIERCTSDNVVKMRSDQAITADSMKMMYRFYEKFSGNMDTNYINGLGPVAPIFVLGLLRTFPYHPQGHVFWGCHEDVRDMFDVPHDNGEPMGEDPAYWETHLRCPIHLGANYCARFDKTVQTHIDDPATYLLDASPKRAESMAVWDTLRDVVMKPFPRIDMFWIKYNSGYWYNEYERQGEYYHDAQWE